MAFKHVGSLDPHGAPIMRSEIITNSVVTTEMDSIKLASGFAALGTAGALVFGHAIGLRTDKGVGLGSSGASGAVIGSFIGTFTAASDNQTVAKVRASCDVSKSSLYTAELDVAIGTTTGSDLSGFRMDLIDEDTLDESTAATTTAQYNTWGTDPNDSTQAVVNIYESQVFGL